MTDRLDWWKRAVFYQVYPRSFQDSDGNGEGDLRGIIQRLDYLKWLGIDAIWLSAIYESPHVDGGYDVSNYIKVDPRYGTIEDADALIEAVHSRGMRVVFGLVPNHTSDQHRWFLDSRSSRTSKHADWYHWQDPAADGGTPNNWINASGDSAWQWIEERRQFYLHSYFPQQPDLNWRNPDVQHAIHDVMRFWLDRNIDGFRIDVLWRLMKDKLYRNDPPNTGFNPKKDPPGQRLEGVFSSNQPDVHHLIEDMRKIADSYGDRVLVGEVYVSISQLVTYYGPEGKGAQLPFNFALIMKDWTGKELTSAASQYYGDLPDYAWPNWVLGNHDQKRVATREGEAGARLGAVLLFTLGGTPFVYNGDEIGMQDADLDPGVMQDPMKKIGANHARDPERTPMQWSAAHAAGFTTGEPWLPLCKDFRERNVEAQRADPTSMLHLYRDLIALRAREDALLRGPFFPLPQEKDLLAYIRAWGGSRFLIVANFAKRSAMYKTGRVPLHGNVAIATDRSRDGERVDRRVRIGGREALVIRLDD